MIEPPSLGLRIVAADQLGPAVRRGLRPGETVGDQSGTARHLPSFFYEVPSWDAALHTQLAPNFGVWELIDVDVREAEPMRLFPRYLPCAAGVLAAHLQVFRNEVGRVVRIAANGGYRSPSHLFSRTATPHSWGTAVNIYRIGDELLDTRDKIEKYTEVVRRVLPSAWVRSYGDRPGYAFDHLHLDLGYFAVEPHGIGAAEEPV